MDFIDLAAQQRRIIDNLNANIGKVLAHGNYIMGPEIKELEDKLAAYIGVKHAISCASGTDALLMALMAYNAGPGDAIFTTPFTFIATAEVISLLGATPVFVDVDPKTYNIDPDSLEKAISAVKSGNSKIHPLPANFSRLSPKGIIAVDLFGLPADYDRIKAIAGKDNLFVIEDAAQSFGAEYKDKKACALGHISCTSFFPAKPLGCYGDGGMCFTEDKKLADIMTSIRLHGKGDHKYNNVRIGINGRLDTLQAAILLPKFDIFPEEVELRQVVAARYSQLLAACSSSLVAPFIPEGYKSVWAQYSVLAQNETQRETLQKAANAAGVPTAIYYPKPLHCQDAFGSLGYKNGDFPICEDFASRIFSLPMHPYLGEKEQDKVLEILQNTCS
ncbi:MAG: DegT/DnrJ/EryC1/StrS family aminotransferase [Smithellaceae bacterium]